MKKHEAFLCPFCGAPYRELIPAGTFQVKCRYCGATVLVPPRLGGLLQLCPMHPESLAVGICNDCGKSFCGDCLFVTDIARSGQKAWGYFHVCSDCVIKRRESEKMRLIAYSILVFLWGFFMMLVGKSPASTRVTIGLLIILVGHAPFIIAYSVLSKRYERLPTVRIVMGKVSELSERAMKVKASMSPREVEDLYRRMRLIDRKVLGYFKVDRLIEKYMKSGLSRKEAILKIASDEGLEVKPGLHIPSTISDALSELKKEMKRAKLLTKS